MRVGARRFSSLESNGLRVLSLIDRIKDKTEIDAEKELFKVKRNMGAFHSKGQYSDALHCALELESAIELLMGRHTAMFASALNNVALMNKMLGNFTAAADKYTQSLVIYDEVVGRKHASYAATLHNLGVLYREQAAADKSHGGPDSAMEREQLLARAEEALGDAMSLRLSLLGTSHKDTISTTINLAALLRQTKRTPRAEEMLREALATARLAHGDFSSVTASCLNALGLLLKQGGVAVGEGGEGQSVKPALSSVARRREARRLYEEALHARSATLGDAHPDTNVSMHNLAELLLEDAEAVGEGEGEGGARGARKKEREREREREKDRERGRGRRSVRLG